MTQIVHNISVSSYKLIESTQILFGVGESVTWEIHDNTSDILYVRFSIEKDENKKESYTRVEPEGNDTTNITAYNIPEGGKVFASKVLIGTYGSSNQKLYMSYILDGGGSLKAYVLTMNLYLKQEDGTVE